MESCYRIPSLLFIPATGAQQKGGDGRLVAVMESKHGRVCGDGVNSTLVMRTSTDLGKSWGLPSFPFKKYASNRKWGQPQMTYERVTHTALLMFSNETLSKSPGGVQSLKSVLQVRTQHLQHSLLVVTCVLIDAYLLLASVLTDRKYGRRSDLDAPRPGTECG